MCYSPITIRNPRKDFRRGMDKIYITVPCGHCEECKQQKCDDLFVRMYYEWKSCVRTFFPTFTYNNENLPYCNLNKVRKFYPHCPYAYKNVPSFDKSEFQNCIKKLRVYLDRENYNAFRYVCVTENGHDNSRPHYHCLFFMNDEIDSEKFRLLCQKAWSSEVDFMSVPFYVRVQAFKFFRHHDDFTVFNPENKEIYLYMVTKDEFGKFHYFLKKGFVNYSQEHGAIIKSVDALSYVTKYLHKDSRFMSFPAIQDLYKFSKTLPSLSRVPSKIKVGTKKHKYIDNPEYLVLKSIKGLFPFYLISNGVGSQLFDELQNGVEDPVSHQDTVERIAKNSVEVDTKEFSYRIPRYIIRKLFFENISVERTELVYNVLDKSKHLERFDSQKMCISPLGVKCMKIMSFKKCINMSYKYTAFYDDQLVKSLFPLCTPVQKELLSNALAWKPKKVEFSVLPFYKLFLQNVTSQRFPKLKLMFETDDSSIFENFFSTFIDEFYETYNVFYDWTNTPYASTLEAEVDSAQHKFFNELKIFEGYDKCLVYFDYINNVVKDICYESESNKKQVSDTLKRYYLKLQNYV